MGTPIGTDGSEFRDLKIVNVVASGVLGSGEIDTDELASELSVEMTVLPGRLYLKPDNRSTVAMVFRSGTYTIAGSSSWSEVLEMVDWLSSTLRSVDAPVEPSKMEESIAVKYLVLTGELGASLNLSAAVIALGMENSEYEPEQFPALIHRPEGSDCTVLLFSTGKITITGAQCVEHAHEVFQDLDDTLSELLS